MRKILVAIRRAIRWVAVALLAALIVTPLAQIVMRGVFNVPMSGAEELTRYFLICLTFLAGAYVTFEGGQIRMEEFQAIIPPRPRWRLQLVIDVAAIALFAFLAFAAIVTIGNNMNNQTATLEMPFWLFMAPLAVGGVLMAIESAAAFRRTYRRHRPDAKQTVLT